MLHKREHFFWCELHSAYTKIKMASYLDIAEKGRKLVVE